MVSHVTNANVQLGPRELSSSHLRQLSGVQVHLHDGHLSITRELLCFHEQTHGEGTEWFIIEAGVLSSQPGVCCLAQQVRNVVKGASLALGAHSWAALKTIKTLRIWSQYR